MFPSLFHVIDMERIAELIVKELREELSPAEQQELQNWVSASASNRLWYERMTEQEGLIGRLTQYERAAGKQSAVWQKIIRMPEYKNALADSGSRKMRRLFPAMAAAAVLILLAGVFVLFRNRRQAGEGLMAVAATKGSGSVLRPGRNKAVLTLAGGRTIILDSMQNGNLAWQGSSRVIKMNNGLLQYTPENKEQQAVEYNTIVTPRGGQYQVILPDGTHVWLDAATSLHYPTAFIGMQREVDLEGEAYFEIAPNASKPFIVNSGKAKITVLGTHFNVNAYDDEPFTRITLLEGAVRVSRGQDSRSLQPGQQVELARSIRVLNNVDTADVMAWRNGKFRFGEKVDIQAIMRQISRWYDADVEYRGNVDIQFWGSITRRAQISEVLHLLETTGVVKFSIEGRKIIVLPVKGVHTASP